MTIHQLCVIVTNAMHKFYPKELIAIALEEAVKFCAACLNDQSLTDYIN